MSSNAERLVRVLDSISSSEVAEVQAAPRKREFALIAIVLVLVGAYVGMFDSDYEAAKMAEERKQELRPALSFPIGYAASMQTCAGYQCEPVQYVYSKDAP